VFDPVATASGSVFVDTLKRRYIIAFGSEAFGAKHIQTS
jgi:hypothetical protein